MIVLNLVVRGLHMEAPLGPRPFSMRLQNSKTNPLLHLEEMRHGLFLITSQRGEVERIFLLLITGGMPGEKPSKLEGMPRMMDSADLANPLSGAKKNEISRKSNRHSRTKPDKKSSYQKSSLLKNSPKKSGFLLPKSSRSL